MSLRTKVAAAALGLTGLAAIVAAYATYSYTPAPPRMPVSEHTLQAPTTISLEQIAFKRSNNPAYSIETAKEDRFDLDFILEVYHNLQAAFERHSDEADNLYGSDGQFDVDYSEGIQPILDSVQPFIAEEFDSQVRIIGSPALPILGRGSMYAAKEVAKTTWEGYFGKNHPILEELFQDEVRANVANTGNRPDVAWQLALSLADGVSYMAYERAKETGQLNRFPIINKFSMNVDIGISHALDGYKHYQLRVFGEPSEIFWRSITRPKISALLRSIEQGTPLRVEDSIEIDGLFKFYQQAASKER